MSQATEDKMSTSKETEVVYKKIVSKGPLPYHYLKVQLEFEEGKTRYVDELKFKGLILQMLKEVYGQVGWSTGLVTDILKYSPVTRIAILRVSHSNLVKLWSSLTMCGSFEGADCVIRVLQTSAHLMALAVDSRDIDF